MRRCPKCNAEYFDNLLEYCLEDGTRLNRPLPDISVPVTAEQKPVSPTQSETVSFAPAKPTYPENVLPQPNSFETIDAKRDAPLDLVKVRGFEAIGNVPIILALAHNWWQWLYLEKQYMSSIAEYILSANFLMWMLLLISGTTVSLFVIRSGTKKIPAYTSLVILAINLILFLVPRR